MSRTTHRRIKPLPQNRPVPFHQEELFMFFHHISASHDLPALTICPQSDGRPPSRVRQCILCRSEKRPSAALIPFCLAASTGNHSLKRRLTSERPGPSSPRDLLRVLLSRAAGHRNLHHHHLRNHDVLTGKKALPHPTRPAATLTEHPHTTAI